LKVDMQGTLAAKVCSATRCLNRTHCLDGVEGVCGLFCNRGPLHIPYGSVSFFEKISVMKRRGWHLGF
jgi:hypothetical protein